MIFLTMAVVTVSSDFSLSTQLLRFTEPRLQLRNNNNNNFNTNTNNFNVRLLNCNVQPLYFLLLWKSLKFFWVLSCERQNEIGISKMISNRSRLSSRDCSRTIDSTVSRHPNPVNRVWSIIRVKVGESLQDNSGKNIRDFEAVLRTFPFLQPTRVCWILSTFLSTKKSLSKNETIGSHIGNETDSSFILRVSLKRMIYLWKCVFIDKI